MTTHKTHYTHVKHIFITYKTAYENTNIQINRLWKRKRVIFLKKDIGYPYPISYNE